MFRLLGVGKVNSSDEALVMRVERSSLAIVMFNN